MKAWVLEHQARIEERPLRFMEVPTPQAQDGQIRIKISVCGICRTDIHIAEGDLPLKKTPLILGHEVVGIVDQVGRGVNRFNISDKVGVYWLYSTCGQCKYCSSGQDNYCPSFQATGWDVDGGFAEYVAIDEAYALPLNNVRMEPYEIAPLMCPGIAGHAAYQLTGVRQGDKLGLYGFGPTASCVLKVAQYLGVETYVSTRSRENIERARREGANWVADSAKEDMPRMLDSAIIFPAAGGLVEPALANLVHGGSLVLAPVSASQIVIENYSENLWGRTIKTLYNVTRGEAEEFIQMVNELDIKVDASLFQFEELQEALILADEGKLEQPNAVIVIAG